MRRLRSKIFALVLLFAVVFTTAVTITGGTDAFGAKRKNTQYSVAGAKYQLYTDSACTHPAEDVNGNNAILTTDANGNTNTLEMVVGTYYAKEITASPGYMFDSSVTEQPIRVVITKSNTESNPAKIESTEPPVYGVPNFKVYKFDGTGKYAWKQLLGTEFTINYYDVATKEEIASATPMNTWKFETKKMDGDKENTYYAGFDWQEDTPLEGSDDFYMVNGKRVIPKGWFTIQETDAAQALALNDTIYYGSVTQPTNGGEGKTVLEGADADGNLTVEVVVNDDPQHVVISIDKQNAAGNVAMVDAATLAGAKYNVYYDDNTAGTAKLVGTIVTDEDGKGELSKDTNNDALEPGDYIIEEVEAAPGFVIDKYTLAEDGSTEIFTGDIEVVCGYDSNGQPVTKTVSGSYKNGKHVFKARVQTTNTEVFTYTVTSKDEPTRTPVKKTDATTTKEIPGARLQIYSLNEGNKGTLMTEWTSTTEEHMVYGLPSGTYLLREITAPYGYDIAEDIEFTVANDKIVNKVEMKDKPVSISTNALDKDTKAHHGTHSTTEVITDTVKLTGLTEGYKYKVAGVLMDKATGEPQKDADGEDITAKSEEFTADAEEMEVTLNFTVDSSGFDSKKALVVFEKLYRIEQVPVEEGYPEREDEELPKELQKHEDINDEDQTIRYGGIIETIATDAKSGTHNMLAEKGAKIVDVVKYENLSTATEYTIEGELYDKTTGKLTGVKASKKFKPEKPDGSVELEFKIDASDLKGHALVAYENLKVGDTSVSTHEDPNDEDQTVHIPEIETIAVNPENNQHIAKAGTISVKDTVTYKNLVPGKTYKLKGTLQYRDGLLNLLKTVQKDGKDLVAETSFTPTTASGTVEVTFTFDATDLEGKTTVVFEDLYDGEYIVATHSDPEDEDQSVHFPKIRTKIGEKGTDYITDDVTFENLIPGKTYHMHAYAVKQKTAEPVKGFTGDLTFVASAANGKVSVKLKNIKGSGNVVVFEECWLVGDDGTETLVGEHKDINDKKQLYKKTGKIVVDDKDGFKKVQTGDSNVLYVWFALIFVAATSLCGFGIHRFRQRRKEDDIL